MNLMIYDAILVSPHCEYDPHGIPVATDSDSDLSYIVPLGLVSVAQHLHNLGLNVRIVHLPHEMHHLATDVHSYPETAVSIEAILKQFPARVCGIQAHWYLYSSGAIFIAGLYKRLFPESLVILGGSTATILWRDFLRLSNAVDGVVLGEGEKTFARIVEKNLKTAGPDFRDMDGLAYRNKSGRLVRNEQRNAGVLTVKEIPVVFPDAPPFRGLYWPRYHSINISRGLCPERCAYCLGNNSAINRRSYQTTAIDKVLQQLDVYEKHGCKEIFLGESHFLNRAYMEDLIENIIDADFDLYFRLETHPVFFEDRHFVSRMIRAKFFRYSVGCESGSDSVLKRIGRNSCSRQILGSVGTIADCGGIALTSWISNLPNESEAEWLETQEVISEVVRRGGFAYWIGNLGLLPGTRFYRQHKRWGITPLFKGLEDLMRWSALSKTYLDLEEVAQDPVRYLTYLSSTSTPEEMIARFLSNRRLAFRLVPEMRSNLDKRFGHLPPEILELLRGALDWYENRGWRLHCF